MPTYDYRCKHCGHALELFQSITESPRKKCPKCGKSGLERQIGAGAAILFRGSGFYQTDYRSDSYKKSAEAESSSAKSGSDKPPEKPAPDAAAKPAEKAVEKPKPADGAPRKKSKSKD